MNGQTPASGGGSIRCKYPKGVQVNRLAMNLVAAEPVQCHTAATANKIAAKTTNAARAKSPRSFQPEASTPSTTPATSTTTQTTKKTMPGTATLGIVRSQTCF